MICGLRNYETTGWERKNNTPFFNLTKDEPEPIAADAPDNVALHGILVSGAAFSFHAAFVPAASTGWRLEVYGEKGTVIATARSGGHSF